MADIAIPDTLHGVLMARIDCLQEETKRILQLASVIGRIFFHRVLAEIAREERQLDTHLLTLQREEMIRERARTPELEYIFKHQLTREAAYNGLLKKEQRIFHRQVAEALERLFPERVEEQVGLLAYHWERAEEPGKATEYLSRAGDQTRLAYAHQEASDVVMRGYVSPATGGFVPPGMPGYSAGIGLPYNPGRARQLLAEAGYPGGLGFSGVDLLMHPTSRLD